MNLEKHEVYQTKKNVEEKIIKLYPYGSRVYGCHSKSSDYDYIIIVESENPHLSYSVGWKGVDYKVFSEQKFSKMIQDHHISALECIFQESDDEFRKKYFVLDKEKLRRAISSVASNSYVKCKKKLRDGEDYIGMKSLFHSLRILNFGIQVAKYGEITSYTSANVFLKIISEIGSDWNALDKRFKPVYNAMKTHFKKLAPLESDKSDEA